jgi:hypothetical protein
MRGIRVVLAALGVALCVAAGCADQESYRTFPQAPAGGAGTGGGGGSAASATPAAPTASAAPAAHRAGPAAISALNDEIAYVWGRLRPGLEDRIVQEARAQAGGLVHRAGDVIVSVRELRSVAVDLAAAPGFREVATDRLTLALPEQGGWSARVSAEVRVEYDWALPLGNPRHTFPVRIEVDDLGVLASADLDPRDPDRPSVRAVQRPAPRFRLSLDSPLLFHDTLLALLEPFVQRTAEDAIDDALAQAMPALTAAQGLPGPVPGDGAPPYADSGAPTPFREVVRGIDAKIARDHVRFGLVMRAGMDSPAAGSWLAAYGPGGAGNTGSVVRSFGYGDSAIWTGHWLAAQAFRHAVTGEPEALANVRSSLEGIGRLIDLNGGTGLPARAAAPVSHPTGAEIAQRGAYRTTVVGADTWVTWAGDGMSRDQLSGLFFGLGVAHERVADPAVRAECRRRIEQVLDYLVSRRWFIDEDRPPFNAVFGNQMPTFWVGEDHQRYAWLLLGERVSPGRYAAELARLAPAAPAVWLGRWFSSFNLDHYYKFNLDHINYYTYFRNETDAARRADMTRGWRMLRRYTGHHRNPHFDAIAVSVDPALRAALAPSCREALRRYLEREHREVAPASLSLAGITWQTFTTTTVNAAAGTGGIVQTSYPSEPLDPRLQQLTGFFVWQRSPFTPATPGSGDPRGEVVGIDVSLPYWMGRYHGIFP